ncbi:OpgC domain-containing protein [Arthrobacter sp. ISL-48]|nr:OpgC domain-containing protein [Arthrobacter sp. ISL-48]
MPSPAPPPNRAQSTFQARPVQTDPAGLRRLACSLVLTLFLAVLAVLLPAGSARAAENLTEDGEPLLGAVLDWGEDSAAGFAERLGAPPAVFGHEISIPFRASEEPNVRQFLGQAAAQGSHALLTVTPTDPLEQIDAAAASEFTAAVTRISAGFRGKLLIRFAPDMNASWVDWGQQPAAYRSAFRAVAAEFRQSDDDGTVMVWEPYLGRDYPFERSRRAPAPGSDGFALLDTNGDGNWDRSDGAYAPYYPGDDAVEWVGLTAVHDDTAGKAAVNTVPAAGELPGMLTASGNEDFYADYVQQRDKPLLLQTAAFYSPSAGGVAETEIKGAWWEQVLETATSARFEKTAAVVWDERTSTMDAGVASIDWTITGTPDVAAIRARLEASALVTAPVTPVDAARPYNQPNTLTGAAVWSVGAALLIVLALLWQVPRKVPAVASWGYRDESARDSRVDFLRGLAIVFVVVNHLGMTSLFQLLTQETIGFVSGAELFVLFSGLVVGMVYGPRVADDFGTVVDLTSRRAAKLYMVALVVLLGVFLVSLLPIVHVDALTTYLDQGTGEAGHGSAGRTYNLYAGMESLFQFPVPAQVVPGIFLLQFGPWQFNVMGLYVILLLLSPLVLAALNRGKTLWVLAATLMLYAVGTVTRARLLPSQFEDSFPLLVWQVLFVIGLVAGFHQRSVVAWFSQHTRVVAACTLATVAFAFLSWGNPYLTNGFDARLAIIPDTLYRTLYDGYFARTYLAPGRLVNVLVLVVGYYAFLTAYWRPVKSALGWFFIPLGRATLYVFILHVVLIAVVANVPALRQGNVLLNSAACVVVLCLLWVMVRMRFLFRIIPR